VGDEVKPGQDQSRFDLGDAAASQSTNLAELAAGVEVQQAPTVRGASKGASSARASGLKVRMDRTHCRHSTGQLGVTGP
jgi:hypothetical protein